MGQEKHKCYCEDKNCKKNCHCEKKCHHEENHHGHCNEQSCMRKRCCKCGGHCKVVYFKKYNECCKFIYKCQCGRCFECICDNKHNCCYERECCCLDKENTIKVKICFEENTCHKKNTCKNHCKKNKCCKCR